MITEYELIRCPVVVSSREELLRERKSLGELEFEFAVGTRANCVSDEASEKGGE